MFGNLDTMQKTMRKIYEIDEKTGSIKKDPKTGNVVLKNGVGTMALTADEAGGYANDSWASLIAENVFGIDVTKKTADQTSQDLYKAMKASIKSTNPDVEVKAYETGGLEQLLEMFRTNMLGNANYMAASEMAMNA